MSAVSELVYFGHQMHENCFSIRPVITGERFLNASQHCPEQQKTAVASGVEKTH